MKYETGNMNQASGTINTKIRIALASLFLVIAGAALGAMPLFAHAQATGSPVFIPFSITVASSNAAGATSWTTYANAGGVIPASATGVILEAQAAMVSPDYQWWMDTTCFDYDAHIKIRKDSASASPEYVLLRGRSAGTGDALAWANQGVFSVSSTGRFQYAVESPGFDGGWVIRILGYTTDNVFMDPNQNQVDSGANASGPKSWTTYDAAATGIPSTATGVILEAEVAMDGPQGLGDSFAHIVVRKDATSPKYTLLGGRSSDTWGDGDNQAWANQGVFPLSSIGTFQYAVDGPGFSAGCGDGWKIRIVGYTTASRFIAPTEVDSFTPSEFSISGSNDGTNFVDWTTYADPDDVIPSNATAVILQSETMMDGPDGVIDVDGVMVIRKNSQDTAFRVLARGRCASGRDECAWANQGVFPLSPTGTFDYLVNPPGFKQGWRIKIVGYLAPPPTPAICTNFGLERATTYDLQDPAKAYGYAVAADTGGNTYITGEHVSNAGLDMYVNKYASDGTLAWSVVYDNAGGFESGYGIAVTPSGNAVYVVGSQQDASLNSNIFVRKYDGADGSLVTSFGSGGTVIYDSSGYDIASAVALDSAGNVYVAGHHGKAGGGIEAILLSYTPAGAPRSGFPITYQTTAYNSSALGITVSGSFVYITGYVGVSLMDSDMFLRQYTTSGGSSWSTTYDESTATNSDERGYGVSANSSGNVFVTGYTSVNGGHTFLRKYDSAGAFVWGDVSHASGVSDEGRGVVAGNSGRIYVAGRQNTNGGDAFLIEHYTDKTKIITHPDASSLTIPLCADAKIGFVYEPQGSLGLVYLVGFSSTGVAESGCAQNTGKRLYHTINWDAVPAEITEFTAIVDTNDLNIITRDWKGTATFTRSDTNKTVIGGAYTGADPAPVCTNWDWDTNSCSSWSTPLVTQTLSLTMDIQWHSVLSSSSDSIVSLYRGDQGGLSEQSEAAFGIAQTNSTFAGHAAISNDVYVVGSQASGGGSAFLNKYSCSATPATEASAMSGSSITSLSAHIIAKPTSGVAPLTVSVDARASSGTIINYEWDWAYNGTTFTNGGTGALASHPYPVAGPYTIALRITASNGATAMDTQSITVSPNTAPNAGFTVCDANNSNNCATSEPPPSAPSLFTGVAPLRVNVDGATSNDPDEVACTPDVTCSASDMMCPANGLCPEGGNITSFSWDWGDGTTPGVGEKATHQYFTPGPYTIKLTVTDNGGLVSATETKNVSVVEQYVCTTACAGATPVCGPTETPGGTACYACLEDATCGIGYQCLGISCKQGDMCLPDADGNPVTCPVDGKCPELITCNPLASAATCPDGSACPASGMCAPAKNVCALSGSGVDTQCYVEEQGSCVLNSDCTESVTGGVCTATGACRYARCSNETGLACVTDVDCADSDGICNNNTCVYLYDCAYGPGMGGGVTGQYATSTPDTMPKMPLGIQPDGQACTQPTSDAPNNCEGINGCLYYNYYPATGIPLPDSNNSVANCVNTFEGGTGCAYYQYYSLLAVAATPTTKTNCLPRYAEKSKKSPQAGIPEGCFVVDKGASGKEYNCTSIDGCYYYLDGSVDCTYTKATNISCTINTDCETASAPPLMIPVCDTNLCEYQGNGCKYEPNPEGAISCPGATKPATGGDNFVQCMLNPDGLLPGFLNTSASTLSSCNTNADCPAGNICINGTCFPACQTNIDCATGEQCLTSCTTSMDCTAGLICDGNACVPPQCAGGTPSGTLWNVTMANLGLTTSTDSNCRYSTDNAATYSAMAPFTTTDTTSHSQQLTGLLDGSYAYYVLCQELSSSVLAPMCQIDFDIATLMCVPGTICPNGAVCPASGICPTTVPACAGAFPTGKLPFGTASTDIGLTTQEDASCHYSLVAIDPYAMMPSFTTTGATSHSTNVVGLLTGANTYYAKCQDVAANEDMCSIAFTVGDDCTSSLQCFGGFSCVNGTCQPPVCENASPTGALAPGTPSTTISMTTPADANCRYSTNGGDVYSAMTPFSTTGNVNHSSFVSGLVTGSNTHYVRCQDAVTSAEKFCSIPFSVGVCNQEYKCATGWMCVPNIGNGICTPLPICTPGTYCPDGQMCPASGICPPPPPCAQGDLLCPINSYCPQGSTYNATTGSCDYGNYDTFCSLNPTHPLCVSGPSGPGGSIVSGITSCNTLGYTFTGTAITPSGNCDLLAIILALLSWMAWIIALLAVLSGLRAAYLYITSMGDERKLILARRYLIYTTIGVGVSVLSFSVVAITRAILNI